MKPFKEVIDGIRKAVMASEVREDIAQGMEHVEQFANTATTKAAEAAASAKTAADAASNASTAVSAAIDPTLSVSGKAADAAKVGEAVNAEAERAKGVESQIKEDFVNITEENKINLFDNVFDELGYYVNGYPSGNEDVKYKRSSKKFYFEAPTTIYLHLSKTTRNFTLNICDTDGTFIDNRSCNNIIDSSFTWNTSGYFVLWTNSTFDGDAYIGTKPFNGTYDNNLVVSLNGLSEEVKSLLGQNYLDEISCWGDSLTYSHNTTIKDYPNVGSVTYPSKLSELTGLKTTNLGMPGANSMDISGLQGGMPIYLDPFILPADTSAANVTLRDANGDSKYTGLLHWMPREGWVNPLTNMELKWNINGIPVNLIYANGEMKVKRVTASDQPHTFDHPVKIVPVHEYAEKQIQIFFVGTNDAPTTKEKAERTVRIVQNMIRFYGGKRYLVVGMTQKNYAEYTNPIFAQTFGNNYVDARNYMIRYGLSDSNITPTSQDTEDIANGLIPSSLRSDSIHFNDYGYTALANCVYYHGKTFGYWD